jgi:dTMP kinase
METYLMQRGKFITFEGSEGCGKSTQIARLVELLESWGIRVMRTREPGGTVVGEKIRHLLQHDPEVTAMCDESELLLFAASRAQLVREIIEPALDRGEWVVADRFCDSTTVYQGIGRGLSLTAVEQVNGFAMGSLRPDLTILLDLDAAIGHARAVGPGGATGDRIEAMPIEFFERVRSGYLALAEAEPERIMVIDASRDITSVADTIRIAVEQRCNPISV